MGTTISGFPNLFFLVGPNTGLGHNSIVFMIESQVEYVIDCLRTMDREGLATVEVSPEAQEAFNRSLRARLGHTVWSSGCRSWYLDDRGIPATWPWSFDRFRSEMHAPHAAAFEYR